MLHGLTRVRLAGLQDYASDDQVSEDMPGGILTPTGPRGTLFVQYNCAYIGILQSNGIGKDLLMAIHCDRPTEFEWTSTKR